MNIGENIKKIRTQNRITQKELAKALNVSIRTIQNYESGNREPNIDTLYKIANIFNVDIKVILGKSQNIQNDDHHPDAYEICSIISSLMKSNTKHEKLVFNCFESLANSIQFLYLPFINNPSKYQELNIKLLEEILCKVHDFLELSMYISPTKNTDIFNKESIYLIYEITKLLEKIQFYKIEAEKKYDDRSNPFSL